MAKYNFVDSDGLNHLISKIKELYTTKASTEDLREALEQLVSEEEARASGAESIIQSNLDSEVSRAQGEELRIEGEASQDRERIENKFDSKISEEYDRAVESENAILSRLALEEIRAQTKEEELSNVDEGLASDISELRLDKVSGVIVNGMNVVDEHNIANIRISDFNPNISIFVMKKSEFPSVGDNSKLYVDEDTSVIWQWDANNNKYIEAGKFNVLLVDELPEVGDPQVLYIKSSDHSINIYVGGDDPEKKWQEINGQDKELRVEFEEYKSHHHILSDIDDATDLHLDWDNIDNKPMEYTPVAHSHNDLYYTKAEVDSAVHEGAVSNERFTAHINETHPHPEFEEYLDTQLNFKADTSLVGAHINNTSNPHQVNKEQIGLGNVDNTSDLDKPISTATSEALANKMDRIEVEGALESKVSFDDIVDNTYTSQSSKPLSAKQGAVLNEMIDNLDNKVSSLGAALRFKGTVASYEELSEIEEKETGDAYQINSDGSSDSDGEMYAWNGTAWVRIVASATDIMAYAATLVEVHKIIDDYV